MQRIQSAPQDQYTCFSRLTQGRITGTAAVPERHMIMANTVQGEPICAVFFCFQSKQKGCQTMSNTMERTYMTVREVGDYGDDLTGMTITVKAEGTTLTET